VATDLAGGGTGQFVAALPGTTETAVFTRRNFIVAATLSVVALLSIFAFQVAFHINSFGVSNAPHYVYQAYSFLHGRWDLDLPAKTTDVVVINGKHYIVYPPFPAIVLMPFVAIFGLNTSDVFITAVLSAINMGLLYLLLEQLRGSGFTRRIWIENVCITLLLYYGSINLWLSLGGRMWFTAHILAMTCSLVALLLALRRHYAWATVALGCAFFSRPTAIFALVFILYLAWQDVGRERLVERFLASLWARLPDWSAIPWRRLAAPLAVTAGIVVLYLLRNAIVFGSPLESGYDILLRQKYPIVAHGPFNIRYVPTNIIANFFTFPLITFTGAFDRHPLMNMDNNGVAVSVFVTTPLFLFLFWRNRRFSMTRAALWVTLGLVVAAVLLFHASGWYQFGARYLYDGYPIAFVLLVLNDVRVDWRFAALGLIGIVINILGAMQFWTGIVPRFF
jgi:hypothetical protein